MDAATVGALRGLRRDRTLELIGGWRLLPMEVEEEGGPITPNLVVWARADASIVLASTIADAANCRSTLVDLLGQALLQPAPPSAPALPRRIRVEDPEVARDLRTRIGQLGIQVTSGPLDMLDDLQDSLLTYLRSQEQKMTWTVSKDEVRPLYTAAAALWRRAPWDFLDDEPPIALEINRHGVETLYCAVLGALGEVYGAAFYLTLADYEAAQEAGSQVTESQSLFGITASEVEDLPPEYPSNSLVVLFSSAEESDPDEVATVKEAGFAIASQDAYPGFVRTLADGDFRLPDQSEVRALRLAMEALNQFWSRHRQRIIDEDWPVVATLNLDNDGERVAVRVSLPPEGMASWAPDPTVYRFRVALQWDRQVWRRIDVRGDQTLDDLHFAIQEAFDWDDDHLYSFFLSGRAWDRTSEYARGGTDAPLARRARIGNLGLKARQRILYIFDYGDELRHDVRLEKITPDAPPGEYPQIVEVHGEAPPQYPNWDDEEDEEDGDDEWIDDDEPEPDKGSHPR